MDNDSPPPTPPAGTSAADSGFFSWLRGLGVTREPGWLGGVAAGVALRLGIDPLLVRGIIVVIAILGGPALFLYAAAWLLLPDASGRIHLQEMFRGVFDRALAGIGILFLLSLVSFGDGGGWWWFGGDHSGPNIVAIIWALSLTACAVWLVVWLANRQPGTAGTAASAAAPAHTGTADGAALASSAPAASGPAPGVVAEPVAPPGPPQDAEDAELAAWRARQAEWKREHEAWRAEQAAAQRAAQQQRLAEERRKRQELAAEHARAAREREQRTRPSSAFTLIAVGLSLVAGGATALMLSDPDLPLATRVAASLSVTLAVLAVAIITNGVRGKRSGGASGVAVLVVIALLVTSGVGWIRGPIISDGPVEWQPTASERSETRTVVSGDVTLDLEDYFAGENARVGTVDLFVVSGDVEVIMPADADGRVEVDAISGTIRIDGDQMDSGGFSSAVASYDSSEDRRLIVDIFIVSGDVTVSQAE